jgi:hypothetical protein
MRPLGCGDWGGAQFCWDKCGGRLALVGGFALLSVNHFAIVLTLEYTSHSFSIQCVVAFVSTTIAITKNDERHWRWWVSENDNDDATDTDTHHNACW